MRNFSCDIKEPLRAKKLFACHISEIVGMRQLHDYNKEAGSYLHASRKVFLLCSFILLRSAITLSVYYKRTTNCAYHRWKCSESWIWSFSVHAAGTVMRINVKKHNRLQLSCVLCKMIAFNMLALFRELSLDDTIIEKCWKVLVNKDA